MLLVTFKFFKISLTLRLSAFLRAVSNINLSVHPYKFALALIKLPLSGLVFYSISWGFVFCPWSVLPKRHFLDIWRFSAWIWVKLAPIYSKRHFFPLAQCFTTFFLRHVQKSKFGESFWVRKWAMSVGFRFLFNFALFPFYLFLSFCGSDWPSAGLASSSGISEKTFLPWSS